MNIIYTIIYLLSALIVVTGFYIQSNKYLRSMVLTQAFQSFIIALIAFLLGIALKQYTFFILGALVILLRVVLVTYFLTAKIPKNKNYLYESRLPTTYYLLVDLAFIVVSIFVVYSISFIHIKSSIFPNSNIILFPPSPFLPGPFCNNFQEKNCSPDTGIY
jgi:Hydrogenase 4 membrane component (E)